MGKVFSTVFCLAILFTTHSSLAQDYGSSSDDFGFGSSSANQFFIGLNTFYSGDNFELNTNRKGKDLLIQGLLGYKYSYFLFGLSYDSDTETQSYVSTGAPQIVEWKRSAIGPTVGFFLGSFYFHLTYFVNPTLNTEDEVNSTSFKYSKGLGLQFVGGYNYKIFPWLGLGLQLAYRSFEYKESQSTALTSSGTFRQAMVDPMLVFMIYL